MPWTDYNRRLSKLSSSLTTQAAISTPSQVETRMPAITGLPSYVQAHRRLERRLEDYVNYPLRNAKALAHGLTLTELKPRSERYLYANNLGSRIKFAEIVLGHALGHEQLLAGPLHFVTLMPSRFAFEIGDAGIADKSAASSARITGPAHNVRIHALQQVARQALGKISAIGMVEAAFWPKFATSSGVLDLVSWHVHLITWGAARVQVERALAPFRARDRNLRDEDPAHILDIDASAVEGKLAYALKAVLKSYRVGVERDAVDMETGEVTPGPTHINKDIIRPGDAVRMMDVLEGKTLDRLLFGNGEGTALASKIRAEALRPFEKSQAAVLSRAARPRRPGRRPS